MYRNTYVEVNLDNISSNVSKIISKYNNYDYYFGVVKADSYGHYSNKVVRSVIDGGCNYLAVSSLEEALEIRKEIRDIPILVLGIVDVEFIDVCIKNRITITISSKEYVEMLVYYPDVAGLKVHLKVNSGMNRLGFNNTEDFLFSYNTLIDNNIIVEGIYSHIYDPLNEENTNKQISLFKEFVDLVKVDIVHLFASDALLKYDKVDFCNGVRLGIAMYGLQEVDGIELDNTFKLISEVIQINENITGTLGYGGTYDIKPGDRIAIIPIGYADGYIRKNKGNYVYINDNKYQIVGNICMDMSFVLVDSNVKVWDKVYLIKDNEHLREIAKYLDTIPYEVICLISKRVERRYIGGK